MKQFFYKHGVFLIGLTPVLVYCLSCLLFEANADSAIQFKKLMLANVTQAAVTPALLVAEYKARVLWQCSSVLSISAYVMAILWSCTLLYRCCQSGAQVKKILLMGSVIVSLTLLQVVQASPSSAIYNVIFSSTYEALGASPLISDGFQRQVYVVVCLINLLAAMTPVFILVAVCSTLSLADHAKEPELHVIVERISYLKHGVVVASIVLLFGIVHMVAWLEWPKALLGESAFAKVYLAYVHANSQYWGLTFTLLLLSVYSVAMWALNSRVEDALGAFPDPESKQKWLNDNSLTMTFQKHALQLGMMLMPTLAGAFDSVLESL